jgi:hypothetical protein
VIDWLTGADVLAIHDQPNPSVRRSGIASSSCAGLTRASIFFTRKFLRRSMDCRVKPGNDDLNCHLLDQMVRP